MRRNRWSVPAAVAQTATPPSRPVAEPGVSGGRLRRAARAVIPVRGAGDDYAFATGDFRHIRWSLALVGFCVYIVCIVTIQIPVMIPGDIAQIGMASALFGLLMLPRGPKVTPIVVGMAALYVWGWITAVPSAYPGVVRAELETLGKLALIIFVSSSVLRSRSVIRFYIVMFVVAYAAYPARGALFNYFGGYTLDGRAIWNYTYANPNDLAVITLLVLSMAAGLLITERDKKFRYGALASVIVLTVLILLTKSRGVFIGLAIFGVFTLFANMKSGRNLGILGVILGVIIMLAPDDAFDRLGGLTKAVDTENLAEVDPERSAEQRYAIWRVARAIIADHPLTGVGWGAYHEAHNEYSPIVDSSGITRGKRDTHSTYLNIAAETGLPGTVIFVWIIASTVLFVERARRRCRSRMPRMAQQLYFLEVGLLGFLVAGIFGSYTRISFLYLHLALMYAMAQACNDDIRALAGSPKRVLGTA